MDAFTSGLGAFDPSVYRFNAIRFVQTGANAFRLQVDETPVIAATSVLGNQTARIDDYFGDGLADVVSDVTCPLRPNALNTCSLAAGGMAGPGLADGSSFVDGAQTIRMSDLISSSNINLLINENQGDGPRSGVSPMFPDLMVVAVNGLKERAQWDYYPLSSSAGRSGSDFPLYQIDGDDVDARHFLFQSSMPVVSQVARSHAVTGSSGLPAFGTRSVRYAYGGAMYHSEGRGFQGFRTIASETLGQPDRTVHTVTTFHQKFPLTGRIESVEARVPQVAGINQPKPDAASHRLGTDPLHAQRRGHHGPAGPGRLSAARPAGLHDRYGRPLGRLQRDRPGSDLRHGQCRWPPAPVLRSVRRAIGAELHAQHANARTALAPQQPDELARLHRPRTP
jgi:hypothetical protein